MLKKKIFIPVLTLIFVFSCLSGTAVFADEEAFPKATAAYGYTFEDQNVGEDVNVFFSSKPTVKADPNDNQNKVIYCDGTAKTDYSSMGDFKLSGNTVIQFDFYQENYIKTDALVRAELSYDSGRDPKNKAWLNLMIPQSETTAKINNFIVNVAAGKWYTVKYVVDYNVFKVYSYISEKGNEPSYIGESNWSYKDYTTMYKFQIVSSAQSSTEKNSIYIDNLFLNSYSGISEQIKACTTADNVIQTIEFYRSNKLITTSFNLLSEDDKAAVAAKILSDKNTYTDDASVITALNNLVSEYGDGSTLYYKWNFNESKSLNDYVNGTEFMMGNKSNNGEGTVTLVADTVNPGKTVAKIDFSKPGEKLTNTTALKNDLLNIKYVVYDITARKDGDKQVIFQTRNTAESRNNLLTIFTNDTSWGTYKSVYSKDDNYIKQYRLNNSVWEQHNVPSTVSLFYGNDIRLNHIDDENNKYGNLYVSSLEVKGYEDFYTEINNATESNVLKVVDAFKDMHVITLPAAYASMDDNAKIELAAALKSKTWTSDDEVITFISCELSDNELVAISDVTEDNTLKSAEFAINKDGITAPGAIAVFASYGADNTLIGVSTKAVTSDFAKYSVVSVSDINLDVTGAAKIKYMLISDLESLMPITASLIK